MSTFVSTFIYFLEMRIRHFRKFFLKIIHTSSVYFLTTLVLFTLDENELYTIYCKTHVFDTKGNELTDQETVYYTKEGQDYRKEADCIGCACKKIIKVTHSAVMDISKDKRNIEVYKIGKIDREIYKCITEDIRTDEVIITDERIEHIRERRGDEFYARYSSLFDEILRTPDYIFREKREHTALVCKRIVEDEKYVNLVLRIAIETDNPEYKNSIITAIGESEKRFAQRLRNNIVLYKNE